MYIGFVVCPDSFNLCLYSKAGSIGINPGASYISDKQTGDAVARFEAHADLLCKADVKPQK